MRPRFNFSAAIISGLELEEELLLKKEEWKGDTDSRIDWYHQPVSNPEQYEIVFDLKTPEIVFMTINTKPSPMNPFHESKSSEIACNEEDKVAMVECLLDTLTGEMLVDVDWSDMEAVMCPVCHYAGCSGSVDRVKDSIGDWIRQNVKETSDTRLMVMSGDISLYDLQMILEGAEDVTEGEETIILAASYKKTEPDNQVRVNVFFK